MTDQPTNQLDECESAARNAARIGSGIDPAAVLELAAEVRRLHATPPMVCINCETPVGWVDCPTGGWWAHEAHPADGHDADPKPAVPAVETGR